MQSFHCFGICLLPTRHNNNLPVSNLYADLSHLVANGTNINKLAGLAYPDTPLQGLRPCIVIGLNKYKQTTVPPRTRMIMSSPEPTMYEESAVFLFGTVKALVIMKVAMSHSMTSSFIIFNSF